MEVGDLFISQQPSQLIAAAMLRPSLPGPQAASSLDAAWAAIAEFTTRLADVERTLSLTVSGPHIISQIALSPEAIKIQSDKIAILGEATFADWVRDLNGTATGVLDPSITRIRGGTIQTEKILSYDGDAWVDLDATGASAFIRSTGVLINANGTFDFGSGTGKHLIFDGSDLTLGTNALLVSTPVGTVVSNAADVTNKLAKAGGDILTGIMDVQITSNYNAGIRAGDVTWNTTTGAITGGTGVVMTRLGLIGVASGVTKFSISASTGAATFAGDVVTEGQGVFRGTITSGGYVQTLLVNDTNSSENGIVAYAGTNGSRTGVFGISTGAGQGVYGSTSTGTGVVGHASGVGGVALAATAVSSATQAILATGTMSITGQITSTLSTGTMPFAVTSTTRCTNLNVATAGVSDSCSGNAATATSASTLSGYSAGNASGNIPISNGVQNTNLYASYSADSGLFAGLSYTTFVRMNQVDCQFSTDGGGSWNNVRFKP